MTRPFIYGQQEEIHWISYNEIGLQQVHYLTYPEIGDKIFRCAL